MFLPEMPVEQPVCRVAVGEDERQIEQLRER